MWSLLVQTARNVNEKAMHRRKENTQKASSLLLLAQLLLLLILLLVQLLPLFGWLGGEGEGFFRGGATFSRPFFSNLTLLDASLTILFNMLFVHSSFFVGELGFRCCCCCCVWTVAIPVAEVVTDCVLLVDLVGLEATLPLPGCVCCAGAGNLSVRCPFT